MNILVVDDDDVCCYEMTDFLSKLGHHVDKCSNGIEALNMMQTNEYQMVLSDIKMPKMSGIDMLKSLTEKYKWLRTDVVLVTGYGDVEYAIEAIRAGAFDYLLKPINIKELVDITERISKRHYKRKIRVLLYISSTILREGLVHILRQVEDFHILGQMKTLDDTINAIEELKPDILLVEVNNVEHENGLNVLKKQVKFKTLVLCPEQASATKLLSLSQYDGFLSHEASIDEIILAIKTVYKGVFYVSPNLSEDILKRQSIDDQISKLNEQEMRIFYLLAQGKKNLEIAEELYLSSATVKTYVSRILQKLNIPNRAAAAVYAAKAYEKGFFSRLNV